MAGTLVQVWSEKPEPNASGYKDCTYASGLMGMVYGGYTAFPKGVYSTEEREALERSDDQPNETGASLSDLRVAIRRRYGKDRVINAPAALSGLLDRDNTGYVVQGNPGSFPAGHRLRRWQPSFAGGHAVFVYRRSDGTYRWLDPLATAKFEGDIVSKADVLTFAKTIGYSMTFKRDEFVPVPVVPEAKIYTQTDLNTKVSEATGPLLAKIDSLGRIIADTNAMLGAAVGAAAAAQNAAATAEEKLADFLKATANATPVQ
jgi:hypothetical protein